MKHLLRMGQWSKFWQLWRVFLLKGYYLMQKLEPVTGGVYLPYCFYNKFSFHNLNCSRYEGFKNLDVPYTTEKMCSVWDIYFLKPSHPLARDSSKLQISRPLFHAQQMFHLPSILNLHRHWQMLLFPGLW